MQQSNNQSSWVWKDIFVSLKVVERGKTFWDIFILCNKTKIKPTIEGKKHMNMTELQSNLQIGSKRLFKGHFVVSWAYGQIILPEVVGN